MSSAKNFNRVKATIFWPTKVQEEKRGCKPYVEYVFGSNTWRAHFTVPCDYHKDRPSELWATVSNSGHYLYDQQRGGINFRMLNKSVVITRTHTH